MKGFLKGKWSTRCLKLAIPIAIVAFLGLIPLGKSFYVKHNYQENVKASERYIDFNVSYKDEALNESIEKFRNGEITSRQFAKETENIKDYDVEKFIREFGSETDIAELEGIKKEEDALFNMGAGIAGGFGLAGLGLSIAGYIAANKEEEKEFEWKFRGE